MLRTFSSHNSRESSISASFIFACGSNRNKDAFIQHYCTTIFRVQNLFSSTPPVNLKRLPSLLTCDYEDRVHTYVHVAFTVELAPTKTPPECLPTAFWGAGGLKASRPELTVVYRRDDCLLGRDIAMVCNGVQRIQNVKVNVPFVIIDSIVFALTRLLIIGFNLPVIVFKFVKKMTHMSVICRVEWKARNKVFFVHEAKDGKVRELLLDPILPCSVGQPWGTEIEDRHLAFGHASCQIGTIQGGYSCAL
mmetsp:Transcript_21945/g.36293  ORF Transcript_21945/g.36293 Transcript_21945/m.36293 type:complete len:249 (-) Transcript_21945:586-1332(-)